ncbi:MAG: hypothetical protein ABTQ34_03475 [Bdellovibrionales bacterium]
METTHIPENDATKASKRFFHLATPLIGERWYRLQDWNAVSFHQEFSDCKQRILAPFEHKETAGNLLVHATQGKPVSLNALLGMRLIDGEIVNLINARCALEAKSSVTGPKVMDKDIRQFDQNDVKELVTLFDESTPYVLLAAATIHGKFDALGIPAPTSQQPPVRHDQRHYWPTAEAEPA